MPRKHKNSSPGENIPRDYTPPRESLRKRIRKHVADPKDKITDADIRNVKVDIASPLPIPENATRVTENKPGDEKKEGDEHTKHITPWDLLNESN